MPRSLNGDRNWRVVLSSSGKWSEMNSLLGKAGSCGKNNSSNVLQKQGTLTPARVFSPFPSQLRMNKLNRQYWFRYGSLHEKYAISTPSSCINKREREFAALTKSGIWEVGLRGRSAVLKTQITWFDSGTSHHQQSRKELSYANTSKRSRLFLRRKSARRV